MKQSAEKSQNYIVLDLRKRNSTQQIPTKGSPKHTAHFTVPDHTHFNPTIHKHKYHKWTINGEMLLEMYAHSKVK